MVIKDRLIALTQKLISFNSENPPGREYKLAQFIARDMKSLGLDVRKYSFAPKRPNVIVTMKGTLPRRQAQRKAILLTPHIDTVPLGSDWKYDPLSGYQVNGKIYGRGATDDKGNLAACMEVMRSLVEDKLFLRKDVILAATVDEETGSHYGMIPLLRERILRPRFALVLDSNEFDTIIAQKGLIHCRLKVFGKKAHGAYNWRGVNAIEIASRIINRLKNVLFDFKKHPLLRGPTINIGSIKGGEKVNMVADYCEISLDIRFLPGMNSRRILQQVKALIKKETKKYRLEIDDIQHPCEIDRHNPYVKAYVRCARRSGNKVTVKGSEGATVMSMLQKYRIPAFATGFGAHRTAHTNNEYIHIKSLWKGANTLRTFVEDYDRLDD
jgi:succinyl-diaminopimelate desuccinylase